MHVTAESDVSDEGWTVHDVRHEPAGNTSSVNKKNSAATDPGHSWRLYLAPVYWSSLVTARRGKRHSLHVERRLWEILLNQRKLSLLDRGDDWL